MSRDYNRKVSRLARRRETFRSTCGQRHLAEPGQKCRLRTASATYAASRRNGGRHMFPLSPVSAPSMGRQISARGCHSPITGQPLRGDTPSDQNPGNSERAPSLGDGARYPAGGAPRTVPSHVRLQRSPSPSQPCSWEAQRGARHSTGYSPRGCLEIGDAEGISDWAEGR
ncbi:MAG: hypothetical protein QOE07_2883 [Acidimicrobiaceae bacterium]|nr:hypothetical protein [Acidimicrobiaceae bacterium]